MIIIDKVTKNFGKMIALDDFSFRANKGEIVGIIGPNGAGKTTLFRIIVGIIRDYKGYINILGQKSLQQNYEFLSYLPEELKFREEFSVNELFNLHSLFYKLKKEEALKIKLELVNLLNLENCWKKPLKYLSKGTKKRAFFISALANLKKTRILILDEPFDGIDPETRVKIRNFLKSLKNKIILFSSHNLFDVEKIASRIIFVNNGQRFKEFNEISMPDLENEFLEMVKNI